MSGPKEAAHAGILARRAARLAAVAQSSGQRELVATVLVLGVGGRRIGVRRASVGQVMALPALTRLPGAPDTIGGILQIKGELLSVIDLAHHLGLATTGAGELLVVVERDHKRLGLRVDELVGFRDIAADELAQTLIASGDAAAQALEATTKDLVAILDIERLFRGEQLRVERGASQRLARAEGGEA